MKKTLAFVVVAGLALANIASAVAQQKPKYAADVPKSILTPDVVETKLLGQLNYFDGMPTQATVEKANDFIVVSRGVEAFMSGMPATSLYAAIDGLKSAGSQPGDLLITETMMDAK